MVNDMSEMAVEVSKKNQDVESENLTQTLDSIHACDEPPREDSIENIFSENPIEVPTVIFMSQKPSYDIINDYYVDTGDSSDEEPLASQANDENGFVNIDVEEPHSED